MSEIFNEEMLRTQYLDEKMSMSKIAIKNNMAQMTIYSMLIKHNIPIRKVKKFQIPRDILYIEYIENNKTIEQISEIFGCGVAIIRSLFKKYNIETRVGKPIIKSILNKELLCKLYLEDDLGIRQIARKLNFSERYISDKLKQFSINRKRSVKQSCNTDLTGKIYGKLTVISYNENDKSWLCNCLCGNNINIYFSKLLSKNASKSCGCSRILKNADWKIIPPYIYNRLNRMATKRGIAFNVNRDYLEDLFLKQNKSCALSGINLIFCRRRSVAETTASLDRIDSNLEYIEGNVQWVHKILNISKHTTDNKEFINWCKLVAEHNK